MSDRDLCDDISDEADLFRNDGADDISDLLDEARAEILRLRGLVHKWKQIAEIRSLDSPRTISVMNPSDSYKQRIITFSIGLIGCCWMAVVLLLTYTMPSP